MEMKEYIREFTLKDIVSVRNPKVVAIGGGTGLSNTLRGLKKYTEHITAVVTVSDDGGSSGRLREELGILPPGDIRSCILALADDESIMKTLFNYRFGSDQGELQGHNFGNLFLAAMNGISHDFFDAVKHTSDVLQIKGQVLPVTLENMVLMGTLSDGQEIEGESTIPQAALKYQAPIKRVYLKNGAVSALEETLEAIKEADIIVIGPGSLYTSIIPNILVEGVEQAIKDNRGLKFYIANLMTQPGETDGFSQADHLRAIEDHLAKGDRRLFKYLLVNDCQIPGGVVDRYRKYHAGPVTLGEPVPGYEYLYGDYLMIKHGWVRHDADAVASRIFETYIKRREGVS